MLFSGIVLCMKSYPRPFAAFWQMADETLQASVLSRLIISNDGRDRWPYRLSKIRRDGTLGSGGDYRAQRDKRGAA